jgi:cytochrome c biogenesis protein CcmG/thiol:disulfide interchange protein DsbE
MDVVMKRLAALLLLTACGAPAVVPGAAVQEVSGRMPALEGATLAGGTLSSSDYAGRVVVVNFWATSCAPCRREQPILSAAQSRAGEDGPFFIGVNYREGEDAARAYLDEFDVRYPSLGDPAGDLAYRFGVPFLPTTVVIDADGRLRYRIAGAIDEEILADLLSRVTADE